MFAPYGVMVRSSIVVRALVAATLGLLASCTLAPIPGAAPLRYRDEVFSAVTTTAGVAYGKAVDSSEREVELQLDLFRPDGDVVGDRPAIVWVHGGSFTRGSRTAAEIVDQATAFARKGYVTASISYRLSPTGCVVRDARCIEAIVDAREDAQAAVRFLRANAATYGIDPSRIAIAGTSAGAVTALNVAYLPDEPGMSGTPDQSSAVRAAMSFSGAAIFNDRIGAGDAPVLAFHGTEDRVVAYSLAEATVSTARGAGLVAELVSWQGEGHVPYRQHRDQIIDLTTNFFYRTLDLDLEHAARG